MSIAGFAIATRRQARRSAPRTGPGPAAPTSERRTRRALGRTALLAFAVTGQTSLGLAQDAAGTGRTERKCALYEAAWDHLASGDALDGVGRAFVAAHEAFLASGCLRGKVCPTSARERALADLLALMAVAEGMTGSFLPFACGS